MNFREIMRRISRSYLARSVKELRKTEDICVYNLGLTRDKRYFTLGVLAYSLSKLVSKPRYWAEVFESYIKSLDELTQRAKHIGNDAEVMRLAEEMLAVVVEWDSTDRRFARNVVQKARLKMASKLYSQGFSLKTTVELTGCEESDLMLFIGNTLFADRLKEGIPESERLKKLDLLIQN